MRIRRNEMIPAIVLIMVAVVAGFLLYTGEDVLGLDSDDVSTLIMLFPGVIVMFVGFYAVSVSSGVSLFAGVAGVGLGFVYVIYALNEAALLIPDLEMTVTEIQIVVLIVFLIIGAGLAVKRY